MKTLAARVNRLPLTAKQVAAVVGMAFITTIGAGLMLGYMLWRARS